jgi:hypothetical protein
MRLDLLSVALRQRDPWEASDLGIALWRRHFGAILRPWLGLSLPVLVLVAAFRLEHRRVVAGRAADVVAQALVRPRAAVRAFARGVRHGARHAAGAARARAVRAGIAAWLSWRRLHPARSLLLPIDLLEA